MKTKLRTLKLIIVLCSAFATTAVFGQVIHTWTNSASLDIGLAANWSPNGKPSGIDGSGIQQTAQWDGVVPGNLTLYYITDWGNAGLGTIGVNLVLTTNQTGNVTIVAPPGGSPSAGIFGITNNSPSAVLTLGDFTPNQLNFITRPGVAGTVHHFVNNSAAPTVMNPSVRWLFGGGVACVMDFGGTGDWIVNHSLRANNFTGPYSVVWEGPGTMTWSNGGVFVSALGPIVINSGKVILKSAGLALNFNNVPAGNNTITNNGTLQYDAAAQSDTIARVISGTGLLKVSNGTLTLSGTNTYTGGTEIGSNGKLVFQGSKTGSGNITVSDNAALGVTDTGTQVTPGTLTLGTSSGATLEFNNVTNTTTALLAPGTLVSAGTITININSDAFSIGQSYPLLTWTSGSAPAVSVGSVNTAGGILSTNSNTIQFTVTAPLIWTGTNNGNWDSTTPGNWLQTGSPVVFGNGSSTLFDDSATGTTAVTINTLVQPAAITVSNNALTYSVASSGGNNIAGNTGLTKNGTGTLTLSGGVNSYTGRTTISAGTLIVGTLANGGVASDIGAASSATNNLMLNGGVLQYTGGAAGIDRLFTVGTNGGTIDASGSGPLTLNNPGTIGLSGALTLAGSNTDTNTLAATLAGSSGLNKSGPGKWVLTGNNTYSGVTAIASGTLQIGTGAASGSLGSGNVTNNGALVFNLAGSLTVGTVSGTGSVTKDGSGTVTLAGDNTYSGGTTINAGTLQIGNGGATGKLSANGAVVINNATIIFNTTGDFTLNGIISGTGIVTLFSPTPRSGTLILTATNTYDGITSVNGATLIVNGGNASIITVNGALGGTGTLSGPVTLNPGNDPGSLLAPGGSIGSIGTLTINNNLSIGGDVAIEVNKSLSPSNDFVAVSGTLINNANGTLTVSNLGPALVVGDKFTLFSKPLQNGGALTVTGAGATWANNLAVDGSITVTAITRPTLNFTQAGNSLQFSWNTSFGTYRLQSQTNSLSVGLSSNWADYPGGGTSPVTVPMDANNEAVFFRLISTP